MSVLKAMMEWCRENNWQVTHWVNGDVTVWNSRTQITRKSFSEAVADAVKHQNKTA